MRSVCLLNVLSTFNLRCVSSVLIKKIQNMWHLFIYLFIYSFIYLFIYLFIHLFIYFTKFLESLFLPENYDKEIQTNSIMSLCNREFLTAITLTFCKC